MDYVLAIGLGLAVRHILHIVARNDPRTTGTLVGLWEGVVLAHFLKKSRRSLDPFLAYALRLFIDFCFTETLTALVLGVVWTGLGVILADIVPALWVDVGLHRYWRRFRRDIYYMSRSIPAVDIFPRARTVRFSPPPRPAALTDSDSTVTPSIASVRQLPRPVSKRHVPGSFESDTDTVTDPGSMRRRQRVLPASQPSNRHSIYPSFTSVLRDNESEVTSVGHDADDGNISSSLSDGVTEDPSEVNPSEIPDELELEYIDTKPQGTPKQNTNMGLPTPTDSLHPFDPMRQDDNIRPPPAADIRTIPDSYDDWEKITKGDAENTPPPAPDEENDEPLPIPPPNKLTPTRKNTNSDRPPPYQDAYQFTDPLTEEPLFSGDGAGAPPDPATQDAPLSNEEQAKSENGEGMETKSIFSDLSENALNSLEGLECLEKMARLHPFIVKARQGYESAVQRHKAVQTSGNKRMVNQAKTEMDAFERKLKNLTNRAESCYLIHKKVGEKPSFEVDLSNSKTDAVLEENVRKTLENFLRPSVERTGVRFIAMKGKAGAPQKDYIASLLKELQLDWRADPSNARVIIVNK
ncbi:hypothetical protein APHAL10511_000177 [Amanita phalloides]|nr:hypothetical protein APHAL10511_000177 [Amanita phalloides]